jgi:ribosomal-protein-alanine N-acetyltransferase
MSELRFAGPGDAAALAELHASAFTKGWTEDSICVLLSSPGTFALANENGFILARVAAGEAEILTLAVRPAARRRGLARRLLAASATLAAQNGAQMMFLEVVVTNAPALGLYRGLGFAQVGRRKAYIDGQDALVLKAELPLHPTRLGNVAETD